MQNDDESRKDARISQRDQKVLATLYDSRRLDWNDPIEVKRSVSDEYFGFFSSLAIPRGLHSKMSSARQSLMIVILSL